jgi:hypothetical protein
MADIFLSIPIVADGSSMPSAPTTACRGSKNTSWLTVAEKSARADQKDF